MKLTQTLPQQLELEPDMWYDRFLHYVMLGPGRNLYAAYRSWTKAQETAVTDADARSLAPAEPPPFQTMAEWEDTTPPPGQKRPSSRWQLTEKKWAWRERARRWDQANHQEFAQEMEVLRIEAKQQRIRVLLSIAEQLEPAIESLTDDLSWKELPQVIRAIFGEQRAEFDDLPTQKIGIYSMESWLREREIRMKRTLDLPEPTELYDQEDETNLS